MRRLCLTCKEVWMEAPPDRLKPWIPKGTPLYRAAGCPDCAMTGYRGRFSIIEVLTVTPEVERRIAAGGAAGHISTAARPAGMKTPLDVGVAHAAKGESPGDELMRGLDGCGVLSHLGSRPATASIPVIVLTAKGEEDNEVRVFELGADDFLTKPFRARALSARLEAVLGRRR